MPKEVSSLTPVRGLYQVVVCPDCRGNRCFRVNGFDVLCAQCEGEGIIALEWEQLELPLATAPEPQEP